MARAYGYDAKLRGAFESNYGTAPGSGFFTLPFISCNLDSAQGLIENDVLGYGRDPQAPMMDVINVDGEIVVPVDVNNFGTWLKSALGAPITKGKPASGTITFSVNPSNLDTITVGGVAFTFKTSPSLGTDIQISSDPSDALDETLDAAVTVLNASTNPAVTPCTYSHVTGTAVIDIVHDAGGSAGNSFTIAASAATASGATLSGGSSTDYLHTFHSGSSALYSQALEIGLSQIPAYYMNAGVAVNSIAMEWIRNGGARATMNCIGQSTNKAVSTQAGTPTVRAFQRFNQFQGSILLNDVSIGNITRSTLNYANNMERIENIRSDGLIEGVDPTVAAMTGEMTVRFSSTDLMDLATAGTSVKLEFSYSINSSKALVITAWEVYLPKPKSRIEGAGGIENVYAWQAAQNSGTGKMATFELYNQTSSY